MYAIAQPSKKDRYSRCIEASRRVRWDIDDDVIRGRDFSYTDKFLPDGLSLVDQLEFLQPREQIFLSQVQGRTYANIFGLVERFINAKVLEISQRHWLGDQVALEALVRFSDEELKHQELFRRIERMAAAGMPDGYRLAADPDEVAGIVLGKSTWAVLGLTCHIELFTQQHYRQSIEADESLSDLYRDVFLYHWKEESQHAILDEIEWRAEDARLTDAERDDAVTDLITLVVAVDGILQAQSDADADYYISCCIPGRFDAEQQRRIRDGLLKAYRWQYIVSGVSDPRFMGILGDLVSEPQMARIGEALAPLMG